MVREAVRGDLERLLQLYLSLHDTSIPADSARLRDTWDAILADPNHHVIVHEVGGEIVSSCVCVIVPNLARDVRPYALVENVVTGRDHRGKGYATACLDYAKALAEKENCYKIMLMTGSKEKSTLQFYRNAGYNSEDKTAFVLWLW